MSKLPKSPVKLTWSQAKTAFRTAKPGYVVVAVSWDDACHTRDGSPETIKMLSIGFLTSIQDCCPKDSRISVTMDLVECGGLRDTTTIPKSLVRAIYLCAYFPPMPDRPHADS